MRSASLPVVMCSLSLTDGREDSPELDSAKDEVEHEDPSEHEREKGKAGRIKMTSTQLRWCYLPCTVARLPQIVATRVLWANQ